MKASWLLGAALVLAAGDRSAHACSCAEALDVRESAVAAHAVFAGKALSVARLEPWHRAGRRALLHWWYYRVLDEPPAWLQREDEAFYRGPAYGYRISFDVQTVWKGDVPRTAHVFTNMSGPACGFPFRAGREYLVYARPDPKGRGLFVSSCSRTIELGSPGSWNDMGVLHDWLWRSGGRSARQYR